MGQIAIPVSGGGTASAIFCYFTYNGLVSVTNIDDSETKDFYSAWVSNPYTYTYNGENIFRIAFGNSSCTVTLLKDCKVTYKKNGTTHTDENKTGGSSFQLNPNTDSMTFAIIG
jgi:hypothetical protein